MDLKKVGHEIQIAGVIYNHDKENITYLIFLPGEEHHEEPFVLHFNSNMWEDFFWQTDVLETEVLTDEYKKTIIRKANRQIDGNISWKVYRRDNYSCRYCGRDRVPLGPSIEQNLVACCKRCNRLRGNTPYKEWVNSIPYETVSRELGPIEHQRNLDILNRIDEIPISFHKMRGKKR
jgi:hypothetical protein